MNVLHIPTGHQGQLVKRTGDLVRVEITTVGPDGDANLNDIEEWDADDCRFG